MKFVPAVENYKENSWVFDANIGWQTPIIQKSNTEILKPMMQYRLGYFHGVSTPEIVDHVHALILADWQISTKSIAETLEIQETHWNYNSWGVYRSYQPSECQNIRIQTGNGIE